MAISFKASASTGQTGALGTTQNFTGDGLGSVPSTTNGIAFVLFDSAGLSTDPTSVTWGGSAMTKLATVNQTTRGNTSSLWYILNPSSGAVTVTSNYASTNSPNIVWSLYDGVKQVAPEASNSTSNTGSASITNSITTLSANAWVISGSVNNFGVGVAGTGVTGRALWVPSLGDSGASVTSPSSYSMTWQGGGSNWTMIMASIAEVPTSSLSNGRFFQFIN